MKGVLMVWAALLSFTAATAQWTTDPLLADTRVVTENAAQLRPFMVPDFAGGTIVVWEDYRHGADPDIYFDRLNNSGNTQWSVAGSFSGKKLCTTTLPRTINKVIADGTGGFYVLWDQQDASDFNVYVQKINNTGQPQWGPNGLAVCQAPNDQYNADFTLTANNQLMIVWKDLRNDPLNARTPQTYAQLVDAGGLVQWLANGLPLTTTTSEPIGIISDEDGGAIVAYLDARNSLLNGNNQYINWDVYAQRINELGVAQWMTNGVAVCTQPNNQTSEPNKPGLSMAADQLGGAIIAWSDYRNDPNNGLSFPYRPDFYAQRLSANGTVQWAANGVPICSNTGNDLYATSLLSDNEGGAIAAWYDLRSNPQSAIYVQRITASGSRLYTNNGLPIINNQSHIINYDMLNDGAGNLLTVYDTDTDDIFLVRMQQSTGAKTGSPRAVCTRSAASVGPALTIDQNGDAFVAWEDYRNNSSQADLFAFKFQGTSLLPVTLVSFTGQWVGAKTTRLQWQVQQEQGIRQYQLQRSTNGQQFATIGTMAAFNQRSTVPQVYGFTDAQVPEGVPTIFYRLQWQQQDGRLLQSAVLALTAAGIQPKAMVSPNPVSHTAQLQLYSLNPQVVALQLIDLKGAMVMQQKAALPAGSSLLPIDMSRLPKGMYQLLVSSKNGIEKITILKQ